MGDFVRIAFVLLLWAPIGVSDWLLPPRAKITIQTAHMLPGYTANTPTPCTQRHITETQLRRMFSTYHELHGNEATREYQVEGCVIEGEIVVDGRRFHFMEQPINLLQTTWPDGKLHSLGGQHSDETEGRR